MYRIKYILFRIIEKTIKIHHKKKLKGSTIDNTSIKQLILNDKEHNI